MNAQDAVDLGRQALIMSLLVSAPALVAGMLVGLVIGLVQALTQIQDQTVAFIPKLVAMLAVLGLCLPWLVQMMTEYSIDVFTHVPRMAGLPN